MNTHRCPNCGVTVLVKDIKIVGHSEDWEPIYECLECKKKDSDNAMFIEYKVEWNKNDWKGF